MGRAGKGGARSEVGMWVRNSGDSPTQNYPACDDNEQQYNNFQSSEDVHESDAPVWDEDMYEGNKEDDSNGNALFSPLGHFMISGD